MEPLFAPAPLDYLEIYVLIDNYVDGGLPASAGVKRYQLSHDGKLPMDSFLAEHGLSLIVCGTVGKKGYHFILDAGCSPVALPHNLDFSRIKLNDVTDVVISHGHEDHMGALPQLLARMPRPTKVYSHPCAFHTPRYYLADSGELLLEPEFSKGWIIEAGAELIKTPVPTHIGNGTFLITGEIPRVTEFEKALPGSLMEVDGQLVPDHINDDQAIIAVLKDRGLVVLTGCAHAGIINTIKYACMLTGIERVYAVIGGFHLSGEPFQNALAPTLDALKAFDPQVLVPMHCTGIEAKSLFYKELPNRVKISGVGTTFSLPLP